jgi:hypothetical protein
MKKQILVLVALTFAAPIFAHAEPDFDSNLHSMVTQKILQDHQSDMRTGKVAKTLKKSSSITAGASSTTSGSSKTASAETSNRPSQVQELQQKHRHHPHH